MGAGTLERAQAAEGAALGVEHEPCEAAHWKVHWRVDKYHEDAALYDEREFAELFKPYETVEGEGNLLLNEGINAIWTLVCGGSETAFNNANARLGVGDSTAAAAATQTDLQAATNKLYKGMVAGYPVFGSNQKVTFQAQFTSTEANFTWNEWSVDNGATAAKNLNRKVESLGTKSGGTWTLTVDITLS